MTSATKTRRMKAPPTPATVRVAIYTRKSVTAGLEQEFNSLDAQREAVEAYVASQRGLGWTALTERYDDNGFSGSNIERPAFQQLMQDIAAGKIDVVCVYRMDRLSRSLLDFTRLTEFFQEHSTGFVSITEAFDTSLPMGRMVLGMLATFAQFERESIAQRTSDKMQASRRRGMWTGGRPPLGYDVVDKKLVVNEPEAQQVRDIFRLYVETGSLLAVIDELNERGWRTKCWMSKKGQRVEGRRFTKDSLRSLLKNPLYDGKMRCGDEVCDGAHEAIIDEEAWEAAADVFAANKARPVKRRPRRKTKWTALLQGIAKCGACGSTLSQHYTTSGTKRYGYYVCQRQQKQGANACPGSRVSTGDLESAVLEEIREIGRDPTLLAATIKADRDSKTERKREVAEDLKRIETKRRQVRKERKNLVTSIAKGGAPTLAADLAALDAELASADTERGSARRELRALELGEIDPDELSDVLSELEPIWAELFPREQQRALELLLERVEFNGAAGEVAITFRPGGPRAFKQPKRGSE